MSKILLIKSLQPSICNKIGTSHLGIRRFCSLLPESPELPPWLKSSQDDDTDPFVLTPVEIFSSGIDHNIHRKIPVTNIDSNTDDFTKILKNRFSTAEEVVRSLEMANISLEEISVEHLLKIYRNEWIKAYGLFLWVKGEGCNNPPSTILYNCIVEILGRSKKFDIMWRVIDEMHRDWGAVELSTMTTAMRRLSRDGRWDEAVTAFREMEVYGVRRDTSALNILMDALVKGNSIGHAEEVFLEFRNIIPTDICTYNILLHGFCQAGREDQAWGVIENMEKDGFSPDVFSYTCLIEARCYDMDFRRVDVILNHMKERGCYPNTRTYTIIMRHLGKGKEISKAVEVYEMMRRNNCVPDTYFYNCFIDILCNAGRIKDVWNLFRDMQKNGPGPDVMTYNIVMGFVCGHYQEETALGLLREMGEASCKPDLRTYSFLMKLSIRKKRMKVLFFLLEHMLVNDVGMELGTYTLLVNGLCRKGYLGHACFFFEEAVAKGFVPYNSTYRIMMKILDKKKMEKEKSIISNLMSRAGDVDASDLQK